MSSAATRTMRRRQREESRQAILDAAERRLRAAPFHALSVDALMSDTGLSRTLFYRHFADLPDVVLQLLRSVGAELMEIGEGWVRAGASEPIGRESMEAIVDFFARNGTLIRAITDAARYDPEIEEVYGAVIERFVDMTAEAIEGLRFEGDARETAPRAHRDERAVPADDVRPHAAGDRARARRRRPVVRLAADDLRRARGVSPMEVLRTPEERFADLPDWPFEPRYLDVSAGDGSPPVRMAYVDEGPPRRRGRPPAPRRAELELPVPHDDPAARRRRAARGRPRPRRLRALGQAGRARGLHVRAARRAGCGTSSSTSACATSPSSARTGAA